MTDRPILFSAPMVRAILDGSKTQTRRVVKADFMHDPKGSTDAKWYFRGKRSACWDSYETLRELVARHCPYGQFGDCLWVRESFWGCDLSGYGDQPCVVYDDEWQGKEYKPAEPRPWARKFGRIPSIHMPRDCSRITLEITGVRVERLQDISEADAQAEGCALECMTPTGDDSGSAIYGPGGYLALWDQINGAGAWDANPWVWVVEFKPVV